MIAKGVVVLVVLFLVVGGYLLFGIDYANEVEEIVVGEGGQGVVFISESVSSAKARQIVTLYDKVEIEKLQDLEDGGLCGISLEKESIASSELGEASFKFDSSLEGESVYLACDQFERYGLSSDEVYQEKVPFSLELSISCDYGRVTTPTVYFLSASDGEEADYCVVPLEVVPQEGDLGECFSEETLQKMKDECDDNDKPSFVIPDANGCDTVYCGWGDANACPSESLLSESEDDCRERGGTAVRYSEDVVGQDYPCAQIRCSICLGEEDLEEERKNCLDEGGVVDERFDHDTGCSFVYCGASLSDGSESGG